MKKIILDTNVLLLPGQFKADIFFGITQLVDSSVSFFILDKSVDELENIIKGKSRNSREKDRTAAVIGKQLLEQRKVGVIETFDDKPDDILVEEARKGAIIATQDKMLIKRIKEVKGKVITMRQRGYFILK